MTGNHTVVHSAALTRVVTVLRDRGAWAVRIRGGLGQQPGLPDVLACLPGGKLLAIEIKTGRGKVGPHQARVHRELEACGAVVLVGDLEHVLAELDVLLPAAQLRLPAGEMMEGDAVIERVSD